MKKVQLQKVIYDQTKGEVDLLDLLSRCLSIRIKSQQWSINSLTGLLDTACTVSMSNFELSYQLCKALALSSIAYFYAKLDFE